MAARKTDPQPAVRPVGDIIRWHTPILPSAPGAERAWAHLENELQGFFEQGLFSRQDVREVRAWLRPQIGAVWDEVRAGADLSVLVTFGPPGDRRRIMLRFLENAVTDLGAEGGVDVSDLSE